MEDKRLYKEARKRVREKKDFYHNLIAYVCVIPFLIALNLRTSPEHWWFVYPMLGWGMGLAMHYLKVFGWPGAPYRSAEWEEREIERELRRMSGRGRRVLPPADGKEDLLSELDRRLEAEKVKQKPYDESDLV